MEARQCAHRWVVFHETYSFCLVEKVEHDALVDWKYRHKVYVADPQHAMLMQPGELHANLRRTPPGDFLVVQVGDVLMKRVAHELGWRSAEINIGNPGPDHPLILRALQRFRAALCRDLFGPGPRRGVCTCARHSASHVENLMHLVGVFVEHCAENAREVVRPERGAAAIKKAIRYLRENYQEPYDLDRLAAAAGCAPHYLVHVFSSEIGVPPSTYQKRILVAKTCEALMASPNKPLQLIAEEVGWPGRLDAHNADRTDVVIRHFRKTLGTTPDEFRVSMRRMMRELGG